MRFRPRLNLVIDALMMLCLAAVAGIGFLMKFVLITGQERIAKYGRPVNLTWLGLGRHEWGAIHLGVGTALLVLLALHIVFHWTMIRKIYRALIGLGGPRWAVAILLAAVWLALFLFPILVQPEIEEGGEGHGPGGGEGRGQGWRGGRGPVSVFTPSPTGAGGPIAP